MMMMKSSALHSNSLNQCCETLTTCHKNSRCVLYITGSIIISTLMFSFKHSFFRYCYVDECSASFSKYCSNKSKLWTRPLNTVMKCKIIRSLMTR